MYIREELTLEVEDGEIDFNITIDTEDGEWEILEETITKNGVPYTPTLEEHNLMQELAEEEAPEHLQNYIDERLDAWED